MHYESKATFQLQHFINKNNTANYYNILCLRVVEQSKQHQCVTPENKNECMSNDITHTLIKLLTHLLQYTLIKTQQTNIKQSTTQYHNALLIQHKLLHTSITTFHKQKNNKTNHYNIPYLRMVEQSKQHQCVTPENKK